ncbi:hypothetical protein N0V84_011482 [Fusarium piperis]|uniref:non-specific serine/threonine protein kinase n=1 Tax=Fusarium piperis TaxID=1435070 RepID=A0A9W8W301_9HYPO|nr:hypothetical protein N0V84_011482 [Fusarium piperis]
MPHDGPHPYALFSLLPLNDRAKEILEFPENAHLVSSLRPRKHDPTFRVQGLDIGFHIRSASRYTLATIGRCGDVVVKDANISRIHCSFELDEHNKEEVMLQDRSSNNSTELLGMTRVPFEPGRPHRRVVVDRNINLEFGLGGKTCDLYQFQIFWHTYAESMVRQQIDYREDDPRQARTVVDVTQAVVAPRPHALVHATGSPGRIRYSGRRELGRGSFGVVWKVANVDTGEHLAVKRIQRPRIQSRAYVVLKREIEILSRVSHRNIVEYRAAQSADDEHYEIFMELKSVNIQHLIQDHFFTGETGSADALLHQMLQALDYLANENIIHRDIKPENILYTPLPNGKYLYQLADFGLANVVINARTPAGSLVYMAPEVYLKLKWPQSTKTDIWSLFVTLACATNADGFWAKPMGSVEERFKAIREAAEGKLRRVATMAVEDPYYRATAGYILDKIYGGVGRTTPQHRLL